MIKTPEFRSGFHKTASLELLALYICQDSALQLIPFRRDSDMTTAELHDHMIGKAFL